MMDLALLVLRLSLGVMFIAHGMQKVWGLFGGPGLAKFTGFIGSLGFSPAGLWAYLAAYVELVGGLCVIAGLGTRLAAGLLLVLIVVAAAKVHLANGFFSQTGGFEYPMLIAAVCLALLLAGGGKFSLTNKL